MDLKKLKEERKFLKDELQRIATEERELLQEKKDLQLKIEEIKESMKESGPELSLSQFEAYETKQRFLVDHGEKINLKIKELQEKRHGLAVSRDFNYKRIFEETINLEGENFRKKNLEDILRLLCLGRLAGGVKLDLLLTHVFQLNSREVNEKFEKMYLKMREEYEAE